MVPVPLPLFPNKGQMKSYTTIELTEPLFVAFEHVIIELQHHLN